MRARTWLGAPGTGKTHLAVALGIRACLAVQQVAFATSTEWIARLAEAQHTGRLQDELGEITPRASAHGPGWKMRIELCS